MLENLFDVLTFLDNSNDSSALKLSSIINKEVGDMQLTYAEKVLLIEGSKAGIADVTVPTFIEYELNSPISQKELSIRSELVEWILDTAVSKHLLQQNKLTIKGAVIMSTADFNLEIWNENEFMYRANRYSLDLSSQQISVDIAFINCNFIHGIDISNSYTENITFTNCRIGISYDKDYSGKPISINAKNISSRGNIIITIRSNASLANKETAAVQGYLVFDNCESNILSIKGIKNRRGTISGGVYANYLKAASFALQNVTIERSIELNHALISQDVNIQECLIEGSLSALRLRAEFLTISSNTLIQGILNLQQARILNSIMLNETVLIEGLEAYDLQCGTLAMIQGFKSFGQVTLTFAKVTKMWCDGGQFYGYPVSIVAGGINSESLLLRDGFIALFGVVLNKCTIKGDIQLSGSFIGPSQDKERFGISLDIRGGTLKNLQLNNGFTSLGMVDLQKLTVVGSLTMTKGRFLNEFCLQDEPNLPELRYAIYANSINIKQKLSFNLEQTTNQQYTDINYFNLNELALNYLRNLINHEMFTENGKLSGLIRLIRRDKKHSLFYVELESDLKTWFRITIPEAIKDELPFEPVLEAFIKGVLDKYEVKLKRFKSEPNNRVHFDGFRNDLSTIKKVLYQWIFNGSSVTKIGKDKYLRGFVDSFGDYAIVFGEAYFEEMTIDGQIDCAGAIFYRKNAHVPLTNALTISHSKVNGTMYMNRGYIHRPLPMLVNGEVDLQYSYIQQLNISPELAFDLNSSDISSNWKKLLHKTKLKKHIKNDHTRWRLIGTKYDYITDDALSINESTIEECHWIFPDNKKGNFKQPFEQFAESLFKNGSDISAREILIYKTPAKHVVERVFVMAPIRAIAFIAYPAYKALIVLIFLFGLGSFIFDYGAKHGAIVSVSLFAYVRQSAVSEISSSQLPKKIPTKLGAIKPQKNKVLKDSITTNYKDSAEIRRLQTNAIDNSQKIKFQPIWYSAQCLIPLVNTDQKDMFKVRSDSAFIYWYFILHTSLGALLIGIFLLGISRIRRNS